MCYMIKRLVDAIKEDYDKAKQNPRDGEAWWAAVYGVTQSRTRRKQLSSSSKVNKISNLVLEINKMYYGYIPSQPN